MAIAAFKDLCLDAGDASVLGPFWATALGLEWDANPDGVGRVVGPTSQHTIWFDEVPERKTVKQRVHLDIYCRSLADLEDLGAAVVEANPEWRWTIMADPEGGEFCAFLRDELPADRLHGVVIDCPDPAAIATWWAGVFGADLVHHYGEGYSTVENVPGMSHVTLDFVPVPEPKTVKNRIHWDVTTADVGALVAAGATVFRKPDDEISWTVLTDPIGHEFCAFLPD
jgi:catechol 2,3-dioxygenase-like lactoylglutathione lyase family enzyme